MKVTNLKHAHFQSPPDLSLSDQNTTKPRSQKKTKYKDLNFKHLRNKLPLNQTSSMS